MNVNPFEPYKILYWSDKIKKLLMGDIPNPVFVTIDPSNYCNSNCKHCFVKDYNKDNRANLDKDLMIKIIKDLRWGGVKAMAFCGGGEPLMNPATLDAIIACGDVGLENGLITNGTLLDDKIMDAVLNNSSFIRLSVDAATKETYKEVHGIDKFDGVINNIKYLTTHNENGTEVSASFLITKDNYMEVYSFADLMTRLGVDRITYKYAYTSYKGINLDYNGFDWVKNNHELHELIDKVKNDFNNVSLRHPSTFNDEDIKPLNKLYNKCVVAPLNMATVLATGELSLCCDRRGELIIGDLHNKSFWDLWYGDKMREVYKNINVNDCPSRCKSTEYNCIIKDWSKFDWGMI